VEQEANDDGSGTSRYSKMIFTNTYAPTLTETAPTEDDKQDEEVSGSNHRFYIQKTVTGDYGDKTKAFTFKITVSRDALDKSTGTIYGYLMTWNGSKWVVDTGNQSGNVTGTSAGVTAIEFTADTEKDVYMTDGQRLVFTTVADGTKITVKEVGESKYKGKVDTLSGSSNDAEVAGSFGTAGSDTSVSAAQSGTVGGTAVTTGALVVGGTKNNYAKFTNDSSENILPNTGIILDNLPYFMLILVALVLAFAYVYVKSRNKKEGHRLS
jgi:hypothetical protein